MRNVAQYGRRITPALLAGFSVLCLQVHGQQIQGENSVTAPTATLSQSKPIQPSAAQADAVERSHPVQKAASSRTSRRRRAYTARQRTVQPNSQPPGAQTGQSGQAAPTTAQRAHDQKILEQQKAQSARIARENDATIKQVVRDQQRVQAEPRIQDAPGVGDQPLAGAPVVPPTQPADAPRIQDAPGPSQTLPKPAPVNPATPQ